MRNCGEPPVGSIVMQVRGPRHRHQDIDVKQGYRHLSRLVTLRATIGGGTRTQIIARALQVFRIQSRLHLIGPKPEIGIENREYSESVARREWRPSLSAFSGEP